MKTLKTRSDGIPSERMRRTHSNIKLRPQLHDPQIQFNSTFSHLSKKSELASLQKQNSTLRETLKALNDKLTRAINEKQSNSRSAQRRQPSPLASEVSIYVKKVARYTVERNGVKKRYDQLLNSDYLNNLLNRISQLTFQIEQMQLTNDDKRKQQKKRGQQLVTITANKEKEVDADKFSKSLTDFQSISKHIHRLELRLSKLKTFELNNLETISESPQKSRAIYSKSMYNIHSNMKSQSDLLSEYNTHEVQSKKNEIRLQHRLSKLRIQISEKEGQLRQVTDEESTLQKRLESLKSNIDSNATYIEKHYSRVWNDTLLNN